MTVHTLKLTQSGDLLDLNAIANFAPVSFAPDLYPERLAQSTLTLAVRGSSADGLMDNWVNLQRAVLLVQDNAARLARDQTYTPIFLQLKLSAQTNTVQTEVLDAKLDKPSNWLDKATYGNVIPNLTLTLTHRPYWEETAAVTVTGSPFTASNDGALIAIPNTLRGDMPAPLKITTRCGAASNTRVQAALKTEGTVANFLSILEAESYTARRTTGSSVADLTDATFSGAGAPQGQRWTPDVTTEVMLLRWTIASNVIDQLGRINVLAAVKDNAAAANTKIRVKPFALSGSTYQYGEWGDVQKFAGAVGARVLVDCGVCGMNLNGQTPASYGYELWGQATATGGSYTFDMDCLYLLPAYEGGDEGGLYAATFPLALGNGANPDGVLDSNDRVPPAYEVDGSGNYLFTASDPRGMPIYAFPSRTQKLIVLASVAATGAHVQGNNNTVTVTYTPRFRVARGS